MICHCKSIVPEIKTYSTFYCMGSLFKMTVMVQMFCLEKKTGPALSFRIKPLFKYQFSRANTYRGEPSQLKIN